jgi:hypothetical protein
VSPRGARTLAAAALALAAAVPARALDVSGSLGAGYQRSDARSSFTSSSIPGWDFGAQLQLSDSPFRPGLLHWTGSGEYRQYRTLYSEGTNRSDNFLYGASVDLFTTSPLAVTLSSSRSRLDFTTSLAARDTGTTLVDTNTVGATLALQHWPTLRGSFVASDLQNERFGSTSETGTREVDLGATQAVGPLRYTASYDRDWNTGTFASTNFDSHQLIFESTVALGPTAELMVNDRYFLRVPTVEDATNPRLDDNNFNTTVRWRSTPRLQLFGSYFAQRAVADVSGSAERQALADAVSSAADYQLTDRLSLTGQVGAGRIEQQLGSTVLELTNETIGSGAHWNDRRGVVNYGLGGTVTFGLVQRNGQRGSDIARGLSARASLDTIGERWNTGAYYDVNQTRDVGTVAGTAFTQTLGAHAEYALRRQSRLRLTAQVAQSKRLAPLFGDSDSRNLTSGLGYYWARYSAQLSAGYTEGISSTPGRIDGAGAAILPAEFSSRTRFVNFTATGPLLPNLWLTGIARTLWAEVPGIPSQQESGFSLLVDYRVGAVTISAEERYTTTDATDLSNSANLFLVRITRSFGASF